MLVGSPQVAVRRDRPSPVGVHLEVQMGGDAVRIPGVAHVRDQLAGPNPLATLEPGSVGNPVPAAAAVVVSKGPVVVQVDVHVGRAAPAVEVEHAAGVRGPRVLEDAAALDGDHGRALGGHDVVPLMAAAGSRVAEVVRVAGGADDGEDEPRDARSRRAHERPRGEEDE